MGIQPKHKVPDSDYLLERGVAEANLAEAASSPESAEIHHKLASAYLDRVLVERPPAPAEAPPSDRLALIREVLSPIARPLPCGAIGNPDPAFALLIARLS
jgi:hypothetical protein